MKSCKKLFILIIIFITNSFICDMVFPAERRNPFRDWFPRIKKGKPEINETMKKPIISYVEEETFDPSIYNVEGLIWGAYKPKAIIRSKIYGLGDKLDETEIIRINKEGVTVLFDEEEYVIFPKQKINIKNIDFNETK
ncbi:hypothetical protein ACFL2Y_03445 [Candidatus Omnitrophota bacterium]